MMDSEIQNKLSKHESVRNKTEEVTSSGTTTPSSSIHGADEEAPGMINQDTEDSLTALVAAFPLSSISDSPPASKKAEDQQTLSTGTELEVSHPLYSPSQIPVITRPIVESGKTLHQFTLPTLSDFSKLPKEARRQIWYEALPGPRVIQVTVKVISSHFSKHHRGLEFKSATSPPAMLHVCHESREIALNKYKLGMRSYLSAPLIYIDFTMDTIYFGEVNTDQDFILSALLRDMPADELAKIRYLGIAQELWNAKPYCNAHVLMDFPNLKKVTFAMEREGARGNKNAIFVSPKMSDDAICEFYDPDIDEDDEEAGILFWPGEVEKIVSGHLEHFFMVNEQVAPELAMKVLAVEN